MTLFEWFLLIVVVIVVPLIVAVVVTLWTIDQANKRKRANRKDAQIGVKRQAALSPEEAAARKAARDQAAERASSGAETSPDTAIDPVATGRYEHPVDSDSERDVAITDSTDSAPAEDAPPPANDPDGDETIPRNNFGNATR